MSPSSSEHQPAYRICRFKNCDHAAARGHGYCRHHRATPEAMAFLRELKSVVSYFDLRQPQPAPTPAKINRFARRATKGDFNHLLDGSLSAVIHQANQASDFNYEITANQFAMEFALRSDLEIHRKALSVVRLSNAICRPVETRHGVKRKSFDQQMEDLTRR